LHLHVSAQGGMPFIVMNQQTGQVVGGLAKDVVDLLFEHLQVKSTWSFESTWLVRSEQGEIKGGSVGQASDVDCSFFLIRNTLSLYIGPLW